jgi:uncharacterized protein YecT (DUF1311 family)
MHCLDGIDYYYGLGTEKDFHKALLEFEKEEKFSSDILFEILMSLNGDGVPVNPARALELWTKKMNAIGWVDATTSNLKKLIDERLSRPQTSVKYLEFKDIAMTTVDINLAMEIDNRIQDQENMLLMEKVERKFNEQELKYWKSIKSNFEVIVKNDSDRIYTMYIDGTIRNAAYLSAVNFLVSRNMSRVKKWLVENALEPTSSDGLVDAESRLDSTFRKQVEEAKTSYAEIIDMFGNDPETQDKYRSLEKEISDDLIVAQQAWAQYRDDWILLVTEVNRGKNTREIELSIKTDLSNERIEELNFSM